MITKHSVESLQLFTTRIAEDFNAGQIPYPVHLSDGNEEQLLKIFQEVEAKDWVFGSWRMHYHALLKGVPADELRSAIHRGESMRLRFPEYRVYGSSIVGGILPIAVGAAHGVLPGPTGHVWCFLGDMTARTGIFYDCWQHACTWGLPITFVVEDNGVSVCTPTQDVVAPFLIQIAIEDDQEDGTDFTKLEAYSYESRYPHAGAGKRVQF